MASGILAEMTTEEVRALRPEVVVVGIGSTEPHGPILPYGTDFFQCDAVCRRAVERANARGARVLMLPTLPIGNNVNFKALPFACRVSVRTLMLTVLDIVRAVEEDGVRKVVLANGHGGNTDALHAALREHFDTTPPERRAFLCLTSGMASKAAYDALEHPSPHGGESETSRMLYLRPDLVRSDRLQDLPEGRPSLPIPDAVYFVHPWHRRCPLGGAGETRASAAEKGRMLIESSADGLADFLVALSAAPWHPDFPYPPAAQGTARNG